MTWSNYEAVIDNILTMNDKTLAAGRKKMVRTIWEQEPSFKEDVYKRQVQDSNL